MLPRLLIIIFLTAAASGCTSYGLSKSEFSRLAKIPKGKASVYIYRPHNTYKLFTYPTVYIDDKPIVELHNNGFFHTYVRPGDHVVSFESSREKKLSYWGPDPVKLNLNITAGEKVFLRANAIKIGKSDSKMEVSFEDETDAVAEMKKTKLITKIDNKFSLFN